MRKQQKKIWVAWLSVFSNTTLVVSKLIVGIIMGSISVISEAVHSGVDLLAAGIALVAVTKSGKPADEEHTFGHGKIENISGAAEAVLIFAAAGWIVLEAIDKLRTPGFVIEQVGLGVAVMFVSSVVNYFVSRLLFKVGRETQSMALLADAWHLRTDVWTSVGVMAGLALIWAGESVFKGRHFHWIDPVAAIIVALLIVKAAYHLTLESGRDLLDVALPAEEESWIREYLDALGPTVQGFHRLRTRKSGETRFVEFHLLVNPDLSVEASHRITDDIAMDIQQRFSGSDVTIHIEPYEEEISDGRKRNPTRREYKTHVES